MKKLNWRYIVTIITGFFALIWFMIRVIPKPSRAAYPCQRAAFPLASAFVLWISGLFTTSALLIEVKSSFSKNRNLLGIGLLILSVASLLTFSIIPSIQDSYATPVQHEKVIWKKTHLNSLGDMTMIDSFDEVSIVRSEIDSANQFTYEQIEHMVREAVSMTGGLDDIIENGDYVVLKPNLVTVPFDPLPKYSLVSGLATDWRVVKAVATLVREVNPDGRVIILESSSSSGTHDAYNFFHYKLDSIPQVDEIIALEDSCGSWENYNDPMLESKVLPAGVGMYPDSAKPNLSPEYYLAKIHSTADVIISIPVLKNHKVTVMTGGIKNVALGMTPHSIYGMSPTFFGKWTKIDHEFTNINKWLHDYYLLKQVDYVVVDGLQGFDHGPTGDPDMSMESQQHNMRLIVAGEKALSVDAVCSNIMSIDPLYADYLVYLDNSGYDVGHIDGKFIRVHGDKVPDLREIFPHNEGIVNEAIYHKYSAPVLSILDVTLQDNQAIFDLNYSDDLNKLEMMVDGELIPEAAIDGFGQVTFTFDPSLLPVDSLTLIASDRFYNDTSLVVDFTDIDEENISSVTNMVVYPNPTSGSINVRFKLSNASQVRLLVINASGEEVQQLFEGKLPVGEHNKEFQLKGTPGLYMVALEYSQGTDVRKIMLTE